MDTTKKKSQISRLKVSTEVFAKIDAWLKDLKISNPEIVVTHSALANWFLSKAPLVLNGQDKEDLRSSYFDEVRFLKQLLKDARNAKGKGQSVELVKLMNGLKTNKPKRKKSELESHEKII